MQTRPLSMLRIAALCASGVWCSAPAHAQDGAVLYKDHCAIRHDAGTSGDSRAPGRDVLAQLAPEQILQALEKGPMKVQAAERSRAQRRVLAEYLSGKPLSSALPNTIPKSAFCAAAAPAFRNDLNGPAWNSGASPSPIRVSSRPRSRASRWTMSSASN